MGSLGDHFRDERNIDSSNHLRELLRLRKEESGDGHGRSNVTSTTLGSVLLTEKRSLSNRTLLDIIREDSIKNNKKTWKNLKDKLLLKRAGTAWTSSVHILASDVALPASTSSSSNNGMVMGRHLTRTPDTELAQNLEPSQLETVETVEVGEEPVRMSLMALLAETDRERGIDGAFDDDGVEEEEEVQENGGGNSENVCEGEYNNSCCVCMVRNKGAALIPCGHTFCRLCCRELWVKRGNCPLCNSYILEILDIF